MSSDSQTRTSMVNGLKMSDFLFILGVFNPTLDGIQLYVLWTGGGTLHYGQPGYNR